MYSGRNTSYCTKPPCIGNIYTDDAPYIPLVAAHGSLCSFDPMLMLETITSAIKNVKRFTVAAIRCHLEQCFSLTNSSSIPPNHPNSSRIPPSEQTLETLVCVNALKHEPRHSMSLNKIA